MAIDLIGFGIVLPILPLYAQRFHTTSFQATLLVAAFSAASFVCSPLWGAVSDRFGRKPVLLVSLAGTAVGSLVTGLAGGLAVLLVGRIIDGASGASVSVAQAAAADLAGPADRHRLFGLLGRGLRGRVRGRPGPGLAGRPRRAPAALFPGRRPRRRQHRRGRSPAARDPSAGPGPRRRRPGRSRPWPAARGVAPLLAVGSAPWSPSAGSRPPSPSSGDASRASGSPRRPRSSPRSGAVIVVVQGGLVHRVVARFGERRTLLAGLLANAAGLALLAAAHSWALAAPALVGLTVGQGLVQTTMVTLGWRGRTRPPAGPGCSGPAVGQRPGPGGRPRARRALLGSAASGAPYLVGAALSAGGGGPGPRPRAAGRPTGKPPEAMLLWSN